VVDQFNASGGCFNSKDNFDRITTEKVDHQAWDEAFTHYYAKLISEGEAIVRRRKLDAGDVEMYAADAWNKLFEYRRTLVWKGDDTIPNQLVAYFDNLARSASRRKGTNRVSTFSEFDQHLNTKNQQKTSHHGDMDGGAENLLSPHPAAEEKYIDLENITAVRLIVANSLGMMPDDEGMMAVLWFFMQWKPKQIADHFGRKDLRNKLRSVKQTFTQRLHEHLDSHIEQHPGNHAAVLLLGLLKTYAISNRDGDLNQKHLFVSQLNQFVLPDEIENTANSWYDQFIASLMHRRLDDF